MMLIGDGVTPGNEGRGYVLRRLLRRAVRSMRLLGVHDPALPDLLPVSMARMSKSYPELKRAFGRISQIAYAEEEAFRRTLTSGTTILDTAVTKTKGAGGERLSGEDAFKPVSYTHLDVYKRQDLEGGVVDRLQTLHGLDRRLLGGHRGVAVDRLHEGTGAHGVGAVGRVVPGVDKVLRLDLGAVGELVTLLQGDLEDLAVGRLDLCLLYTSRCV